MQTAIPCCLFRGGTSKGPVFLATDLPKCREQLSRVLLAVMGSPHPRQIDGLGGAESLTSKVAIVGRSSRPGSDVEYLFAQVTPASGIVDFESNCGNMLSAVGPFAVEKGLVRAAGSETSIRIHNLNTDSIIIARIETPGRQVTYEGTTAIDGVAGTAARIEQNFAGSVGSGTGALLPSGRAREEIEGVEVTCLDAGVPAVILRAADLGKTGHEAKAQLDADSDLIARLESVRLEAGMRMGIDPGRQDLIPKPIIVAAPRQGGTLAARDFVPYNCHAAFSVTGAVALATACLLPGSVPQDVLAGPSMRSRAVSIEHPSGSIDVQVAGQMQDGRLQLQEATVTRTCRKLFEGMVFVPSRIWNGRRSPGDLPSGSRS